MKMKRTILKFMQTCGHRLAVCTIVMGLTTAGPTAVYAQTDDEEEVEVESGIKQPDRSKIKQVSYPTILLKGKVVDLASGHALAGVQLRALGYDRYTAMTEEDGTFSIKVPVFATALYVQTPEYLAQQVGIVAGDSTQVLSIKMLSDKFSKMYDARTEYTARRTAQMDRFGVTIDNEVANKLGADVRSIMRSAAADGCGNGVPAREL